MKFTLNQNAVEVKAELDAEGQPTGPPKFSALAYSGDKVSSSTIEGMKLSGEYVIDLAGMTSTKVMVNLNHKPDQMVGHATEVANDKSKVMLMGLLSAATPYREQVAQSAKDGFPWEVSIEGNLSGLRQIAKGKSEVINGRTFTGPLHVFSRSELTGVAFVSRGADKGNSVTIAATADKGEPMTEFEKFVAKLGLDPAAISDDQKAELTELHEAKLAKTKTVVTTGSGQDFAALMAEERAESERKNAITKMALEAGRTYPLYNEQIEKMATAALQSKASLKDFELELLRGVRTVTGTFRTGAGAMSKNDPKILQAALAVSAGLPDVEKHYKPELLEQVNDLGMRNFGLQELLLQIAIGNGYVCRAGESIHTGNIRSVLEYCFPPVTARMGFSNVTLPGILGNVANKEILAGYMEEDMSWKEIATVKPVTNFYQHTSYRLLDSLEYEQVGSGGEIKHGTLGQESYTRQAKTYGKMLGITREQIINDDLGAFDDLRAILGRGAAKKFNNVFWAAFIDNSAFFTAALTNYISGSTTTLLTDNVGLDLAMRAFRTMTTPAADGSKRVGQDLNPTILVVPPELETNAMTIYKNTNLGAVANSSANIYQNRFRPVVQWRLSNSSYTGYSTTAWYLFGDRVKPMVVSFLNGQQTPTVESTDADFSTLGIQFRGYHDFGCDKAEYLAGIKSKGAA